MKKITKNFRKTMALTLATTFATSSVVLANPTTTYENTHRTLLETFQLASQHRLPVSIVIPPGATDANIQMTAHFNILMQDSSDASFVSTVGYKIEGRVGLPISQNIVITLYNAPDLIQAPIPVITNGINIPQNSGLTLGTITVVNAQEVGNTTITIPISGAAQSTAREISIPINIPVNNLFVTDIAGNIDYAGLHNDTNYLYVPNAEVTIAPITTVTGGVSVIESMNAGTRNGVQIGINLTIEAGYEEVVDGLYAITLFNGGGGNDVTFDAGAVRAAFRTIVLNAIDPTMHGSAVDLSDWVTFTGTDAATFNSASKDVDIHPILQPIVDALIAYSGNGTVQAILTAVNDAHTAAVAGNVSGVADVGDFVDLLDDLKEALTSVANLSGVRDEVVDILTALIFNSTIENNEISMNFKLNVRSGSWDAVMDANVEDVALEVSIPGNIISVDSTTVIIPIVAGTQDVDSIGVNVVAAPHNVLEIGNGDGITRNLVLDDKTITLTLTDAEFLLGGFGDALLRAARTGEDIAPWLRLDNGHTLGSIFGSEGNALTATVTRVNATTATISLSGTFDYTELRNLIQS